MTTINVYDKSQVDTIASGKMDNVSTSGASEGDVLTLDSNLSPVWSAGGGGSTSFTIGDIIGAALSRIVDVYDLEYFVVVADNGSLTNVTTSTYTIIVLGTSVIFSNMNTKNVADGVYVMSLTMTINNVAYSVHTGIGSEYY